MVRPATYPENSFLPRDHHDSYPYISTDNSTAQCGRYVLISGASKGVGRSMAISFAKAGASGIALLARSSLDSTKTAVIEAAKKNGHEPPTVLALNVDIADRAAVEGAAAKVKEVFRGKLDLVINNAGYLENWVPLADTDVDDWWRSWEVNVKGTYLMDRTFIPLLLAAGGEKTLITVTSAGAWVTFPGGSGYQGSKTAVVRLNNHIHAEYAEKVGALFQGLLVYSIHPGGVKTELALGMPEVLHKILVDEPDLAADTMVWLTNERREWLSDRYVDVSWNMEKLSAMKDEIVKEGLLKLSLRV